MRIIIMRNAIMRITGHKMVMGFLISLLLLGCELKQPQADNQQVVEPAHLTATQKSSDLAVTYIANEGVLISAGEDQVLIDALHKPYRPAYLPTPPEVEAAIMQGEPPFESVDFMLVSHVHGDHFDAQTVATYLSQQPAVPLFTSPQAIDSVQQYIGTEDVASQLLPVTYESGKTSMQQQGDIVITAGKVAHGSERFAWVQNLGHIIQIGNRTLLHVGDPGFGRADIEQLLEDYPAVDVAILPSWFVTEAGGRAVIDEVIKPTHLIVVHVSPGDGDRVDRVAQSFYSGAAVFTTPMERVTFGR